MHLTLLTLTLADIVEESASPTREGPEFPATALAVGTAAAANTSLFGGFGRRARSGQASLFGGAANLNGEVGALLPRLCTRKAEVSVEYLMHKLRE
jgi:hypothetical protein